MIVFALLFSMTAFSQNPYNILRKYKNDDGVVAIKFEGDMLNLLKSEGETLKSELDYMDIIVFKEGKDMKKEDKKELTSLLKKENFQMLINAKHEQGKLKIMGLDGGDWISKVYANVQSDKANVYVVMKGKIYFEELQKLNVDKLGNFLD